MKKTLLILFSVLVAVFGALKVDILSDATAGFTPGTSNYNYDASCTITIYQMANGAPLTLTNFG